MLAGKMTEESKKTDELFPGKQQIRPGISFRSNSQVENARTCRKKYRKSDTNTPGIFTAQCVCSKPKMLGTEIVNATDGTSTALTVLLSRFRILQRLPLR